MKPNTQKVLTLVDGVVDVICNKPITDSRRKDPPLWTCKIETKDSITEKEVRSINIEGKTSISPHASIHASFSDGKCKIDLNLNMFCAAGTLFTGEKRWRPQVDKHQITCHHCGHTWMTKSISNYVTCSKCLYKVKNYA